MDVQGPGSAIQLVPTAVNVIAAIMCPLLLANLLELAQGPHDVIHHGPPGHEVGVDEVLLPVKEGIHRLFGPGAG